MKWKLSGGWVLISAICVVALGLIVTKFWPSDLVTKPDSLLKAATSNDPRKVFAVMGQAERDALDLSQSDFAAIYDACFRPSFDGVRLTGYKTSEINGSPAVSGYVGRQAVLTGGSTVLLMSNSYITERGAQTNVLKMLLYMAAACEAYKVNPAPSKVEKGRARLALLSRLAPKCEEHGVMGLYDEESRKVILWAEMEKKLNLHLAHFMKG